jgi:hypothetical protein
MQQVKAKKRVIEGPEVERMDARRRASIKRFREGATGEISRVGAPRTAANFLARRGRSRFHLRMAHGVAMAKRIRACTAFVLGMAFLMPAHEAKAQAAGRPKGPAPAPTESVLDADTLYEEGRKAAKAGQVQKARELYLRSWRLRHHWQVAGSLGRIELTTGNYRDAAEHLTYFLSEAPANMDEGTRKVAQEMLGKARTKVGVLKITVNRPGAEVLVDGQIVGTSPLANALFVEPGPVFIQAQLEGYVGVKMSRTVVEGGEEDIQAILTRAPPEQHGADSPSKTSRTLVISSIATTGVGLSIFAGFGAAALTLTRKSDSKIRNNCKIDPAHCPGEGYVIDDLNDYNKRAPRRGAFAIVSAVGLGMGGLGAAALIYELATSGSKQSQHARAIISATPDGFILGADRTW